MPVNAEVGTAFSEGATASETCELIWGFESRNQHGTNPSGQTLWLNLPCRIGRSSSQDLCLNAPTVSGRHALLQGAAEGVQVCDLGSTNGTFVNGSRVVDWTPLVVGDLVQFGSLAFVLVRGESVTERYTTAANDPEGLALSLAQMDRLLAGQLLSPHFQAICFTNSFDPFACEALARSRVFGLSKPDLMFTAAAYSQREALLSRMCRKAAMESSKLKERHVFLNVHPKELEKLDEFLESLQELRQHAPQRAITIEIPELAEVSLDVLLTIRRATTDLKLGLAFDDFGAGQSRLHELAEVAPDFVKFDIQLVKQIDSALPTTQKMLATLIAICRDLGIRPIAEGVETCSEVSLLVDMGCELGQGYIFGRPC